MRIRTAGLASVVVFRLLVASSSAAGATVDLASATMGTPGYNSGQAIGTNQFLGWRFEITGGLRVTHVGGHLVAAPDGGVFAAIVRLDDIDSLPAGAPFLPSEIVATAAFTPPAPSNDAAAPLNALLGPGAYALVFGSGLYDGGVIKTGTNAAMVQAADQALLGGADSDSFLAWIASEGRWRTGIASPTRPMRFVLRGDEFAGPGDFQLDGDIDGDDLAVWNSGFGMSPDAQLTDGDATGDGSVTGADFLAWQRTVTTAVGSPPAVAIPEPATAALAAIAMIVFASMSARQR